jgi:nucleoside-diphosphate-sugar epimerase
MSFTVLGAGGVIGRALTALLRSRGHDVRALARHDAWDWGADWGHVIYAVGLTADFRNRPFDTVEAHVSLLAGVLKRASFDSLLYLSSTRVYAGAERTVEQAPLHVNPSDPSDLYNLSKLMGEALCLAQPLPTIRVARLSNVIGGEDADSPNFIAQLRREAGTGCIRLLSALDSAKDYIHIDDACELLIDVATGGRERLYNVASGENVSHGRWAAHFKARTGCRIEVAPNAPLQRAAAIDVTRIRQEFGRTPRPALDLE